MNFLELAKKRYSCRELSDKVVPDKLINEIIEAGIVSPTAVNKQPYHLWLVESEEGEANMKAITPFTFGAKKFIIVGYDESIAWVRKYDGRNFADIDASIVATQIMLAIEDAGLATTWVGHFDAPKLKEIYPQMKDYGLIAIFPIGYAADSAMPSKRHFERMSPAEMVTKL